MTDREESGASRYDRLSRHATPGPRNSLRSWTDAKHPLRVAFNYACIVAARRSPESTPDVFWPELITVGDDAIIGYDATLLCHEFLQDEYRTGEVRVGERAMIGAGAVVLPGVEIGPDAQVAANSLVAEDVPPGETWAGVPAEPVDGAGDEER
ncbi:acetyltransferase [Halobacteriales archaeon QS_7_69_60]|nr:MAG: acetyltransferase [Halobacteriales archaeon QS_7_69_60]